MPSTSAAAGAAGRSTTATTATGISHGTTGDVTGDPRTSGASHTQVRRTGRHTVGPSVASPATAATGGRTHTGSGCGGPAGETTDAARTSGLVSATTPATAAAVAPGVPKPTATAAPNGRSNTDNNRRPAIVTRVFGNFIEVLPACTSSPDDDPVAASIEGHISVDHDGPCATTTTTGVTTCEPSAPAAATSSAANNENFGAGDRPSGNGEGVIGRERVDPPTINTDNCPTCCHQRLLVFPTCLLLAGRGT